MAVALVQRALIQGDPKHAQAKMREGFKGSWAKETERKLDAAGNPVFVQRFTIEERGHTEDGSVRVLGYYNCVAKGDVIAQIEAAQWTEVELLGKINWNRDTKYLNFEVMEVKPVQG